MRQYLDLVSRVMKDGKVRANRTGTDTFASFSEFYKVDLSEGYPLLTTKTVNFRSVIMELLWYLRGEDHIRWLRNEKNVHIWDAWADDNGWVGPAYPVLWRRFPGIVSYSDAVLAKRNEGGSEFYQTSVKEYDQIRHIIDLLENNPNSRRMVLNTWYPGLEDQMALPPCHCMVIFSTIGDKLNCHLTQRSGDIALGIPFNLACYTALTMILAQQTGFEAGEFAHTIVDAHIYTNHVKGLNDQLDREPSKLPTLEIANKDIDELEFEDFALKNYNPQPPIKFEVAV